MEPSRDGGFWTVCFGNGARERRAAGWFVAACAAWAAVLLLAAYVLKHQIVATPAAWAVAAVPALGAIGTVLVFVRFLRDLDELQRGIQIGALAFGFGAMWVAISSYPLFERVGAPAADSEHYVLVMMLAYMIGNVVAWIRYR